MKGTEQFYRIRPLFPRGRLWLRGLLLPLLLLLLLPGRALAADVPKEISDGVHSALEQADVDSWNSVYASLPEEVRALWGGKDLRSLVEDSATGQGGILGPDAFGGRGRAPEGPPARHTADAPKSARHRNS